MPLSLQHSPSGDAPSGDAPSGDAPSGDSPSGDSPSGDSPSGEEATEGIVEERREETPRESLEGRPFPVVGVGASAGGLQAFRELLQHLPVDPGLAIVFVQHLLPSHESSLCEILARDSKLPVLEATDNLPLEVNHVYVIPPDQDLAVLHGALQLMDRPPRPERHLPVDYLFRSLADDLGRRAIGVILSGTGSDGVQGVKAIKAAGGITLAQDEGSAGFSGMPEAASASGRVDLVLSPAKIAEELCRVARHPHLLEPAASLHQPGTAEPSQILAKIFVLLRRDKDVDFSQYKRSTVERRIARRMVLHKIDSLKQYLQYLQRNTAEVRALFDDMLINVTSFFRDPESFLALKEKVFPQIVRGRDPGTAIRIWVPACSTGEEAYSLAIALLEFLHEQELSFPIQIFATDVSEAAIARARLGRYPEDVVVDLSDERLRKFFTKLDHGYQISKPVRDLCVFARQNIAKEPPFSNLDLLSCRNLLIYLGSTLQKRVIPTFHYALRPSGYLMLGRSETIGGFSDLFSLVDREQKIYAKKETATCLPAGMEPPEIPSSSDAVQAADVPAEPAESVDLERQADQLVIDEFGPPGLIVNQDLEILQFRGQVAGFVAPASGAASLNLMRMICPDLKLDIRALIHQVRREPRMAVKQGVACRVQGRPIHVDLEVHPLGGWDADEKHFLVLFKKLVETPSDAPSELRRDGASEAPAAPGGSEADRLREELRQMKAVLQDVVEDQDATNEELRAANEEIQSSNEELQSTNEELETAKEELQSSNEELMTLNAELEHQYQAANRAIDDFNNLHRSVGIPVILLDNELRIRRFTPPASQYLGLRDSDCGRRIGELRLGVKTQDGLEGKIREVFHSLNTVIEEVESEDGRWYSLQIRPYRTTEDRITGAVVVLIDISEHRRIVNSQILAESVVAAVRESLLVVDAEFKVVTFNPAFLQQFQMSAEGLKGRLLWEVGEGVWDHPELRRLLAELLPQNKRVENFELTQDFVKLGRKRVLLDACRIEQVGGRPDLILLCFWEVTDA